MVYLHPMLRFLAKRLASILVSVWLVITLTFFLLRAVPGGPFTREKALPDSVIEQLNAKYRLDEPVLVQYTHYLKGVVTLDFGPTYQPGITVNERLATGFPNSGRVGLLAIVMILFIGIPAGLVSAFYRYRWPDYTLMFLATLGVAVPAFVIGTLFVYLFSARWHVFPSFGLDSPAAYVGPVVTIGAFALSFVARLTRTSVLEVLQQDYIRTAYAKGLSSRQVVLKHVLKNALIPVLAYVGPMMAAILTGSFVTEKIFAIPGIGKYFVESIGNRDYPTVMGVTVFYTVLLLVMTLVTDIVYSLIDPRIKFTNR